MDSRKNLKEEDGQESKEKPARDAKREETNKTDPQLTELRGFVKPEEPLEEEGTLNPFTGNKIDKEES